MRPDNNNSLVGTDKRSDHSSHLTEQKLAILYNRTKEPSTKHNMQVRRRGVKRIVYHNTVTQIIQTENNRYRQKLIYH